VDNNLLKNKSNIIGYITYPIIDNKKLAINELNFLKLPIFLSVAVLNEKSSVLYRINDKKVINKNT
jgi:hypothetical protein